ncbi:multidrug resistance-associated protein [Aspergillus saccharolyticus JOP 1030-1]|uniref:Multidrug resistance-associated protein n=1 Tax=Aspergillus saccharolyticus JOP 1030-1 TaxID=1450539 RepID=A0A318ZC30_9EURO|nr:multidrug resistance-associated protein [Aspergillus saccharolyticus JOP 1030-1]PYH42243.1 multidrug resistance-associated protein [Aspergillus saccharolyticus JOP 1030-1]
MSCLSSDNSFGPQVCPQHRFFDFTLLFQDAFFATLPSAILILLILPQLLSIYKEKADYGPRSLIVAKCTNIALLLIAHVLFVVFRSRLQSLHTDISTASGILCIVSTTAVGLLSRYERRPDAPSDILVLYFSLSTLLAVPRLRSLWMIPGAILPAVLWAAVVVLTLIAAILESMRPQPSGQPKERERTPDEESSFWGRALFLWTLPLLRRGKLSLEQRHLFHLDAYLAAAGVGESLEKRWTQHLTCKARDELYLVRSVLQSYRQAFLVPVIPRLLVTAFRFCLPFLISTSISYFESSPNETFTPYGYALVGAFVLVFVGIAISTSVYGRHLSRFLVTMRGGLIYLIYKQTMLAEPSQVPDDRACITLIGTDVERIISEWQEIHELWASPLEIGIAIYLLQRQLGVLCIVPVIVCVVTFLLVLPISVRSEEAQKTWIEEASKRINATINFLHHTKAVKILGLGPETTRYVLGLRKVELASSRAFRKLIVAQIILSNVPLDFTPFITLTIFAVTTIIKGSEPLLAQRAFTSLSIISLLTSPMLHFLQAVPSLVETFGCFERIDSHCKRAHHDRDRSFHESHQRFLEGSSIVFDKATFSWSSSDTGFVLQEIDLALPATGYTAITGPTGSGKSCLLQSILGQTCLLSGGRSAPPQDIAYCPQEPWIFNDTVRMNIVVDHTSGVREDWYRYSIWASSLERDLCQLLAGDGTLTGSNGVHLSGGQKMKISLARAIYSQQPIIVIDDIFRALDSQSIHDIWTRCFAAGGYFSNPGIHVIVVTDHSDIQCRADRILMLEKGHITKVVVRPHTTPISTDETPSNQDCPLSAQELNLVDDSNNQVDKNALGDADNFHKSNSKGRLTIYQYYARAAGYSLFATFILGDAIGAFTTNFATVWLERWTGGNNTSSGKGIGQFLGVYGLLACVTILSLLASSWLLMVNIVQAVAFALHWDLLKSVSNAPLWRFQGMDTGDIVNRFSQDMELIDEELPVHLINFSAGATDCVVKLVIICVIGRYFAISIPLLLITLYLLQSFYLPASRQLRHLVIQAKAPIITHILEAMTGIASIKAYNWQQRWQTTFEALLDQSQQPIYMQFCIQQWLTLVLDLTVAVIAAVFVAVCVPLQGTIAPGLIGVALNLIITFSQSLNEVVKSWTQLETAVGAVSRVYDFSHEEAPGMEEDATNLDSLPGDWPSAGEIQFRDACVAYRPTDAPILSSLTLTIPAGSKVAICGRSGSGKTSLILSILSLVPVTQGSICIDGMDLSTAPGIAVRRRLTVIPQEPFFLPGSVRDAVDPWRACIEDTKIERALRRTGLWEKVYGSFSSACPPGGADDDRWIDQPFSVSEWSVGEKQLLAIARALAVESKVVILDEASNSLDRTTKELMQGIVETELAHSTVLSVMHHFEHIERFDQVIILKDGKICETGPPQELLQACSEFRKLYDAAENNRV